MTKGTVPSDQRDRPRGTLSAYVNDRNGRTYTFATGSYRASSPRVVFDSVGATLAGLSG